MSYCLDRFSSLATSDGAKGGGEGWWTRVFEFLGTWISGVSWWKLFFKKLVLLLNNQRQMLKKVLQLYGTENKLIL